MSRAEEANRRDGGTEIEFVVSRNLHRRHLNESQRAAIAAEIANMERTDTLKRGPDAPTGASGKVTIDDAAKLMNVGTRTVDRPRVN